MSDRPRVSVSVSFLVFGLTVGALIPRVPALKDQLHLTDGEVGIALLGVSVGGIAGSLASRLAGERARPWVRAGTTVLPLVAVGPGLAFNLETLVLSLVMVGFLWGFVDALENALGAGLERIRKAHLINGFHGFWSLGAFIGSLIAGVAASQGVSPWKQFVVTGLVLALGSQWFLADLPDLARKDAAAPGARPVSITAAVVALAAMSFAGVIAEGGTSDWSALFLRELSHAGPGLAAAGFSGFTIAATLVRFRADRLTARTSRAVVARGGAALAVAGLALAIAFPSLPTAIAGFTIVGMGTAVVLPLAFAAGANLGRTGISLAIIMASTYGGTIAGPPLIGALADRFGLRIAMAVPLTAAALVLVLAGTLGRRSASSAQSAELAVEGVSGR